MDGSILCLPFRASGTSFIRHFCHFNEEINSNVERLVGRLDVANANENNVQQGPEAESAEGEESA